MEYAQLGKQSRRSAPATTAPIKEPCQKWWGFVVSGGVMKQTGQPSYALFAGNDSSNLKTFVLEVDSYRTEDALLAIEKAISELKICQLQFGYVNDYGVRAIIR